ncbi:MAG: hypothetical protein H0X46_02170 [Bacteroidetes bacterium]|nr:hypothetical protein [Bacteroidota bacterium]
MITNETRIIDLTVGEFETLMSKTVKKHLEQQLKHPANLQKEFYSPKEFGGLTGIPYSTVIFKCKMGKIRARQDEPNGSWLIRGSELERYRNEAVDNM